MWRCPGWFTRACAAQRDCAQGTCGRSFGCRWRLGAHGCGPAVSACLMPVHLCGSSDRSTCGLREQDAGGQGARWLHGASAGLERDRGPQPLQSLVSGNTGPYCRSGCPTAPHALAPDPQQHLPPGRWRGCLTPWPLVLPWPGGFCRTATGDHGGTLGLFSAVGVLTAQGLCLPLPPVPKAVSS